MYKFSQSHSDPSFELQKRGASVSDFKLINCFTRGSVVYSELSELCP